MSVGGIILILFVLALLGVLAWAGKPLRMASLSVEDTLEILSASTHSSHIFPVLQALRPEDAEFLIDLGYPELAERMRKQRKRVGLLYLQTLQSEFECLLAASRTLAVLSPKLVPMLEFERLRLSIRFELLCGYMRFRLKFGLSPQREFSALSTMAGRVSMAIDRAAGVDADRASASLE